MELLCMQKTSGSNLAHLQVGLGKTLVPNPRDLQPSRANKTDPVGLSARQSRSNCILVVFISVRIGTVLSGQSAFARIIMMLAVRKLFMAVNF